MKNTIVIILLSLAGGILFYWKGCHAGPVPDRRPVDSVLRVQDSLNKVAARKLDSLTKLDAWHQRREDSLTAALMDKGAQLNAKAAAYRDLVARGDVASARHDTAATLANADTMRQRAREGLSVIREYINLSDSTVQDYIQRLAVKDTIIATWSDLSRTQAGTIGILTSNYNKVYADDRRRARQNNFLKPLAITGAGIIVFELAKGFILKK